MHLPGQPGKTDAESGGEGDIQVGTEGWIRIGQLVVAALGFVAVIVTIRQKTRSDNRAKLWRRYTWATDKSLDEGIEHQLIGWVNLGELGRSMLRTRSEEEVIQLLGLEDRKDRDERRRR